MSMVDKSKGFGKDRSLILFMTINSNSQDLVDTDENGSRG